MKILFVCTGNTCRSCMAEALLKSIIENDGKAGKAEISSAGVFAIEGDAASENAVEVLKDFGASLKEHRAKRINKELIDSAQLILSMTAGQKRQVIGSFPGAQDKLYTLKEYANLDEEEKTGEKNVDIRDPFGMNIETYRECAAEIYEALQKVYARIKNDIG